MPFRLSPARRTACRRRHLRSRELQSTNHTNSQTSSFLSASLARQVNCLQAEHNPDVMLLAARALTVLADVLPASAGSIVRHGAVPHLVSRLLNIEYIDLAEQSLQVGNTTCGVVQLELCVEIRSGCMRRISLPGAQAIAQAQAILAQPAAWRLVTVAFLMIKPDD